MPVLKTSRLFAALGLFALAAPHPSLAFDAPVFAAAGTRPPVPEPPPCTCRGRGGDVPLGASLCLRTPDGWRVATCVSAQNVTSWQAGEELCAPISALLLDPATMAGG